jgi:hypothetical protein
LALSLALLFAENHQQLRIGGENLPQSVLKPAAGLDPLADVIHPLFGNPFDPAFPIRHECRKPDGMAFTRSAVAGGFAATAMGEREGAGQQILGQGEAAEHGELALAPASGLGTFWGGLQLNAIMHSEMERSNYFFDRENRTGFLA